MTPQASVIVPCYNSSATIRPCLQSLVEQQTSFPFEIIAVDSSTDGTERIIADEFPTVRLIHRDERTMASDARNIAVEAAACDTLCFTDSDCVAQPGWLQGMVDELHKGEARIIVGGVRPANPRARLGLASFLMEFRDCNHRRHPGPTHTFLTCNLALTREAFSAYGPFPTGMWPGEDTVFAERARAAGELMLFRPAHQIAHINRGPWKLVLRHQRTLGSAGAAVRHLIPTVPTGWMLDHPYRAAVVVILGRPLRTVIELAMADPATLATTLPMLPLMVLNCFAWVGGFLSYRRPADA